MAKDIKQAYAKLLDQNVVLDTAHPVVYVGCLAEVDDYFVTLEDAEIYDVSESQATKAMLVMEACRNGIVPNRKEIKVRQEAVLSLSLLEDICVF